MISQNYSITGTRQILIAAEDKNRYVCSQTVGNSDLYLGGSDVTSSNGIPMAKHESFHEIFVPTNETIYAVCADGATESIRVLLPNLD